MDIHVMEIATETVIGTWDVHVDVLNYWPRREEYFDEAWKCAVEDEKARAEDRAAYTFRFALR